MTIEKALEEMLSEHSIEDLLEMVETLGDSYLEISTGGVDMTVIHQQRTLEKFLKKVEKHFTNQCNNSS